MVKKSMVSGEESLGKGQEWGSGSTGAEGAERRPGVRSPL